MGNWTIIIQGHGCHHNNRPDIDADLATLEFIQRLRAQGHELDRAQFILGLPEALPVKGCETTGTAT